MEVQMLADILASDSQWLATHYDELIAKYPGKVVAIEGGQIVGVADTREEVCRPFVEAGVEVLPLVIDVPHPETSYDLLI
ncbi:MULTISPECIES: DUF5678 domain-containing protein [Leptolyngbya]|uniref:DUF5678 domain-containing protein n=1 Tax=Leptolyngbya TaxID=47251 RepID=UPI001688852B|nr:DUF5678 domain-containing protein [Leptolyngbya sp. FACHB-1624]MBD1857160.1 hypothetical protein [Leptolyngbya sp. FACHB-1624]